MRANTIKIEEQLLNEILDVKPKDQSLSAFVKSTLAKELRRLKVQQASQAYVKYLQSDKEEASALETWEKTDLVSPPKHRGRK